MTESEWLTSEDPIVMLDLLCKEQTRVYIMGEQPPPLARRRPSDRKLLLFVYACGMVAGKTEKKMIAAASGMNIATWAVAWSKSVPCTLSSKVPQVVKANLIREIVGNPFRSFRRFGSVVCDHTMKELFEVTSTMLGIAKVCYDTRNFTGLPILADALEEVGIEWYSPIVRHLRGWEQVDENTHSDNLIWKQTNHPHVQGCWVLDLLLGKE